MIVTGNGQQNQIREKASFVWKYFADARKRNLILSKDEGDYLEQSELGFGIFFADGHTDKQMIPHSIQW
jgi:hypothetical protein